MGRRLEDNGSGTAQAAPVDPPPEATAAATEGAAMAEFTFDDFLSGVFDTVTGTIDQIVDFEFPTSGSQFVGSQGQFENTTAAEQAAATAAAGSASGGLSVPSLLMIGGGLLAIILIMR